MDKLTFAEILQFKNENEAKNEETEEKATVVPLEKSEPVMVDRNQYNVGDSFHTDDVIPEVKDDGIEIR